MRKGFIAGMIIGGLVGAYYGMQMTTREKSELRGMAMRFASRGKQAMRELTNQAEEAVNMVEDMVY